jgi:hypothetical protein
MITRKKNMVKLLLMLLLMLAFIACQQPATSPAASGLRKISVSDQQTVERLRQSGVKILVEQPNYLVVYSDSATASLIQMLAVNAQPATERDLVQRLTRIHFADKAQLQKIVDLGVDLWEAQGDSAIARVYDWHLEQLEQEGYTYRILKMDANAPEDK